MQEIEVKILDVDREHIEKMLRSLGAKKIFDDEITTILYDFAGGLIKKAKDLIRLRKIGNKSILTFKKYIKHPQIKVREEYEVEVSNFETMHTILNALGLNQELQVKKHRISYILGDVHFDLDRHLDDYGYIPEFLEIEAKNEETVYRYATLLGYTKDQCKPWGFPEVADYYKSK